MTILETLIHTARDLNEPDDINVEYARGQANLIVDACGLSGDHTEQNTREVFEVITHRKTIVYMRLQ